MSKGVQSVRKNLPPKPPVPKKPDGLELRAPRKPLIKVEPPTETTVATENGKTSSQSEDENSSSTSQSSITLVASSTPKVKDMIIKFEKTPPKFLNRSRSPSLFDPGSSRNSITSVDLPDMSDCPSPDSFTSNELTEPDLKDSLNQTDIMKNKQKKALNTAEELLKTERDYVDVLKMIVHDFRHFIMARKSDIPESSLDKILDPLPQILGLNEQLLLDFEARILNWDQEPRIADVLTKIGPFLKIYSTYIQQYNDKMILLDECCNKYPGFAKLMEEFEASQRCRKITLKNHMLNPVQRLPRYEMLLTQYLHYLDESSPDFESAGQAVGIMKSVTLHANSSVHDTVLFKENFSKLYQIQTSFAGSYEIIKPGRTFIREGELYKLCRKGKQARYFILFSDSLLHADYSPSMKGTLRLKHEFPLRNMKVECTDPFQFSIITNLKSFALKAKDESECKEWVHTLLSAIDVSKSKQSSLLTNSFSANALSGEMGRIAPVWMQDKDATMCPFCTQIFTAVFRRHHCRSCGKVVCKLCSNNRAPLEYFKFEAARVCTRCHDYLLEEFNDPSKDLHQRIKVALHLNSEQISEYYESIKLLFKKNPPKPLKKKSKKSVPKRLLEVTANDSGSQMSGWLDTRTKKSWKRFWFVLKDKVLYWYHAPQDVVALGSAPVLGYTIDRQCKNFSAEIDEEKFFRLSHPAQTFVFVAPDKSSSDLWLSALQEAATAPS